MDMEDHELVGAIVRGRAAQANLAGRVRLRVAGLPRGGRARLARLMGVPDSNVRAFALGRRSMSGRLTEILRHLADFDGQRIRIQNKSLSSKS